MKTRARRILASPRPALPKEEPETAPQPVGGFYKIVIFGWYTREEELDDLYYYAIRMGYLEKQAQNWAMRPVSSHDWSRADESIIALGNSVPGIHSRS